MPTDPATAAPLSPTLAWASEADRELPLADLIDDLTGYLLDRSETLSYEDAADIADRFCVRWINR